MPAAGIPGWKRSKYQRPILHSSKSPETSRKSFLELIKNTERRNYQRGATLWPRGWEARPTPLGVPPASWAPWQASGAHLLLYEVFYPVKNHKQAFRTKHRRHEAEPIQGSSGAVLPGKHPSGRGKSPPSSSPSILSSRGGQSPSTSSPAPSPLKPQFISCIQSLSHSLRLVPVGCQQC